MVKRILKFIVGLLLSVSASVALFMLDGHLEFFKYDTPSETFIGIVSEASYVSKEDTAKAFLEKELTGITAQPVYMGYERVSDLNDDEIDALAIDEVTRSEIEAAEKIQVYYTCDARNKTANTCLLKMNDEYHYYVSLSLEGEVLTNSYFETVLDGAKYLNCTSTTTVNFRLINPQATTDATYRQVIQFDDNIAYMNQEFPGLDYEMYFTENSNSIQVYLEHPEKSDGKFYSLSEINRDLYSKNMQYKVYLTKGGERVRIEDLSTLQDITDFMFMMQLDASFFVKTSYGFSMPEEKYKEVCKLMAGEEAYAEMEEAWDKYHIHFNSDYYVSKGRLSASKTVLTMSDGEDVFALTVTANYTDFGTTEVEHPYSGGSD